MARVWRIAAAAWLAVATGQAQNPAAGGGRPQEALPTDAPTTTFGVTVVDSTGLEGKIYLIKPGSDHLPNFKRLKPMGSIYTTALNIPPRHFTEGFPGITDRFEWFAIDYTGKFWIEQPQIYYFALLSDDGSRLYIDGHLVIDNDGIHPAATETGKVKLTGGVHQIRVSYFQGPRDQLALVLAVSLEGVRWRIFNTKEFRPSNPDDLKDPAAHAAGTSATVFQRAPAQRDNTPDGSARAPIF
jgi:PA14 domain